MQKKGVSRESLRLPVRSVMSYGGAKVWGNLLMSNFVKVPLSLIHYMFMWINACWVGEFHLKPVFIKSRRNNYRPRHVLWWGNSCRSLFCVWFGSYKHHVDLCYQLCSSGQPSCLAKTLTLDIACTLFSQIFSYLPCLCTSLTSIILYSFLWPWSLLRVTASGESKTYWLPCLAYFSLDQEKLYTALELNSLIFLMLLAWSVFKGENPISVIYRICL